MAEGIPGSGNAGGASLCLDMDVGPLARAVQVASEDISPEDMKNLSDPSFRASAARWRSGPQTRKVTAAFARLLSSLSAIKPDCFKRTVEKENSGEMPVVEALPMTEVARKNPTSWKWFCGSTNGMATWVAEDFVGAHSDAVLSQVGGNAGGNADPPDHPSDDGSGDASGARGCL